MATEQFVQEPCNHQGGSQEDPSSHWKIWWTPDPGHEMETKLFVFRFNKDNYTRHSERNKEEVDRRRDGKTILKSGQEWAQLEKMKAGHGGKGLLRVIWGAPTTRPCKDMGQNRLELNRIKQNSIELPLSIYLSMTTRPFQTIMPFCDARFQRKRTKKAFRVKLKPIF